MTHNCSIHYVL